jgi:fumarate hydratase subunit beta
MNSDIRHVRLPFTPGIVKTLHAGDRLLLSGELLTARDAAHKRLVETLAAGETAPVNLTNATIYYTGPSATPPGRVIGSAGPTTAYRMDPYCEPLLKAGVRAMIGKGEKGETVQELLEQYCAVYCAAVGGAGAYLSERIISSSVVAYEELGPEAIHAFTVREFPVVVAQDVYGGNVYRTLRVKGKNT